MTTFKCPHTCSGDVAYELIIQSDMTATIPTLESHGTHSNTCTNIHSPCRWGLLLGHCTHKQCHSADSQGGSWLHQAKRVAPGHRMGQVPVSHPVRDGDGVCVCMYVEERTKLTSEDPPSSILSYMSLMIIIFSSRVSTDHTESVPRCLWSTLMATSLLVLISLALIVCPRLRNESGTVRTTWNCVSSCRASASMFASCTRRFARITVVIIRSLLHSSHSSSSLHMQRMK